MITHNGKLFIFDIFIKAGKLYLVSTHYSHYDPPGNVFVNGVRTEEFSYNSGGGYHPTRYFFIDAPENPTFTLRIDDVEHRVTARIEESREPKGYAVITIFKHDYARIPKFVQYYKKQGFTDFIFYYNGPKLPDDIHREEGIQYFIWNYPFHIYNKPRDKDDRTLLICSQSTFFTLFKLIHMDRYRWSCANDLDEWFVSLDRIRLVDYLESIPEKAVMIRNHWAYFDGDIIHYTKEPIIWQWRTKMIYKWDFDGHIMNHNPHSTECEIRKAEDLMMLHLEDTHQACSSRLGERKQEVLKSGSTGKFLNLEGELYDYED
jgi:hypothetical protein